MTGMDILEKLQLRDEIREAVRRAEPMDLQLTGNFEKNLELLEPFTKDEHGLRIFRYYLDFAVTLKEQYDALGIPETVFWDGMKDISIWAEDYWQKHGVPGIAEWGWVLTTLSMRVFRLGRLQFEPTQLEEDLTCGDRTYSVGTPILGVHIPAGESLDIKAVQEAMGYAPRFFKTHFQKTFALFHCHSWLISPQLKEVLPEDSRIMQFQNLFEVCYVDQERQAEEHVFGFLTDDPARYPDETSLQKKMKASLLTGKSFGMGRGIRVIQYEQISWESNHLSTQNGYKK